MKRRILIPRFSEIPILNCVVYGLGLRQGVTGTVIEEILSIIRGLLQGLISLFSTNLGPQILNLQAQVM